ncbi:unnamed protein product [Prunus armeniaca]
MPNGIGPQSGLMPACGTPGCRSWEINRPLGRSRVWIRGWNLTMSTSPQRAPNQTTVRKLPRGIRRQDHQVQGELPRTSVPRMSQAETPLSACFSRESRRWRMTEPGPRSLTGENFGHDHLPSASRSPDRTGRCSHCAYRSIPA